MNTATAAQIKFYNGLLDQIARLAPSGEFSAESLDAAREAFPARTVSDASASINRALITVGRLKDAAPAAPASPAKVEVADGRYALVADGVVKFYEVRNVTEGKWAGYTFVDAQASDDFYKVGRDASKRILAEIAQDPQAAMKLYGHSLGKCGHCGRTLTDKVSRANGIGPVCNKRMGWA